MQGTYDIGLVALSYLIASLAGFVAIEFASRMRARSTHRMPWLLGGALAMGTGIWSMHFVGMTAFSLPVPISYDVSITALSWLAAVGVSALALYIVGYGQLRAWTLAVGALVMGAGICLMHYGGMWAMRMDPGIVYRPGLFAASAAIAVVASGAALLIIATLREVHRGRDVVMRVGAALVMGLAVCGMHYTGMAAAEFADGAFCFSGNRLQAGMLPLPTSIATLLILGFGIAFTITDARDIGRTRRALRERDARVQALAFLDRDTGLPNRARLSQLLLERIHVSGAHGFALVTLRIEGRQGSVPPVGVIVSVLERINRALPGAVIARTQPEHLVVMVEGSADDVARMTAPLIEKLSGEFAAGGSYRLSVNSAHCPSDGTNAQWLLLRSAPKSETDGAIGHAPATPQPA